LLIHMMDAFASNSYNEDVEQNVRKTGEI
jgi:hypothetical protein